MTQQARIRVVVLVVAALVVLLGIAFGTGSNPNRPLEEKDSVGVSAPTATLLAALLGVGLGLFGDRYMRHRGDLLCRSSDWNITCTVQNLWKPQEKDIVPFTKDLLANERVLARAEYGNYSCTVKLFNETEVDTGLRDIRVAFLDASGATTKNDVPQMADSRQNFVMDPDVLNLPARQWVSVELYGRFGTEEFEPIARSAAVEMRAYLPREKPFVQQITRLWD
jgi:hypothetical protein